MNTCKHFTAKEALVNCTPNATEYVFKRIEEAIKVGSTNCYVNVGQGRPPIPTVAELVKNGFDIHFSYYEHNDNWLVKAHWGENACGRIYHEEICNTHEISFEELIAILRSGKRDGYMIEVSEEEKEKLTENHIKYEEMEDGNIIIEDFDIYIEALIMLDRFNPNN